jgi:uncharacterized membrane protein
MNTSTMESRPTMRTGDVNVAGPERVASAAAGAVLGIYGLARGGWLGLGLAGLGGALVHRGLSGHCNVYAALSLDTAHPHRPRSTSVFAGHGVKVVESFRIDRSHDELYRFWRDLDRLPTFMRHLKAVTVTGEKRSHWAVEGPTGTVEWDAEIINDRPNELIAWRSLPGADVDNAGSVHFQRGPDGHGTEVLLELKYDPRAGKMGILLADLLGLDAERLIREDLHNFKRLMEAATVRI